MGHAHHKVLVKEVKYDLSVPNIVDPSMMEQETPKESKLTEGKVCRLRRSLTFLAKQTNPHVGLLDHIDIILSITNSQCYSLFVGTSHHLHYICFLLG